MHSRKQLSTNNAIKKANIWKFVEIKILQSKLGPKISNSQNLIKAIDVNSKTAYN